MFSYFYQVLFENKYLRYGRQMESVALKKFSRVYPNVKVMKSGLIVCPELPFIGATPDAILIMEDGRRVCLEIKCPYTCKDKVIKVPYLEINDGGLNVLKSNHEYYIQMQIQLYLAKCDYGILFVYSSKDYKIAVVLRDNQAI